MPNKLSPVNLYRLPWNLADNSISWLEPTSKCNIYCDGCYRENRSNSHKSLEEIRNELDVFEKFRKTDAVSIAGGEPLLHPNIIEIVKMVKGKGWKPNINTNGALLTVELIRELREAGVESFTVHIDSGQNRPGWKGKNELELNELRLSIANMVKEVGGISLAFNSTVYPETMQYIPELMKWGQQHIDKVHIMVFILYRIAVLGKGFDFYVGTEQVKFDDMMYSTADDERKADIQSEDLVEMIRTVEPIYEPCAFLNGTENPASYKWLMSGRLGNKHQIFGYVGPRFMEIVQTFKHIFTGSYLAYAQTSWSKRGRFYFLMVPFDKGIREIAKNYFKSLTTNIKAFFSRIHYQTVLIIQPADLYPDGRLNMCDGCPDITVWNDQLIWSCRMEEQLRWGQNIRVVPKKKVE
jgi:hypothetical protein